MAGIPPACPLDFKGGEITNDETAGTSGVPKTKHKVTLSTEIGFNHLQIRYINDRLAWKERNTHREIHAQGRTL